jgi:aldose 1-epimerase
MNFSIDRKSGNGFELLWLTENATGTQVAVNPGAGALLHGFVIPLTNEKINIIDNYKDGGELADYLSFSYKGCKLSPFACRIPGGKWHLDQIPYEFGKKFRDGSAIHGLLYDKPFRITDEFTDDNMASVTLRYHYKADDKGYPFEYVCEIRYILQTNNVLQLETTITNLSNETIPLVDGWHPYFNLGGEVNNYILGFRSDTMLEFNEALVPTGQLLNDASFITPVLLGDREIDNCFVLDHEKGLPCCVVYNPQNKLKLTFFASDLYRYLQIFTPKHRRSIAIENLSGAPDAFNNGIGLLWLEPRRSTTFNVWYRAEMAE